MKIVDSYGNELGYQQGDQYVINNKSGDRLGWINGLNDIINNYGTKVGELRNDGVFDVYGNRVGEVNGNIIISLLEAKEEKQNPSAPTEKPGLFVRIIGLVFRLIRFLLSSWGGRIGVLIGIVLAIRYFATAEDPGSAAQGLILMVIMLGLVGKGIDGIISLVRKKR